MKLKVDKEQFLINLEYNIQLAIKRAFLANSASYYGQQVEVNFNEIISMAVSAGVVTAMEQLIEYQYTDEDFERDIGLKT